MYKRQRLARAAPVPPPLPVPVVLGPPHAASATVELEKIVALQPDVILRVYTFIDGPGGTPAGG